MPTPQIFAQEGSQLAPLDALRIVAAERQALHEKIVRLRALREAAEAEKALTALRESA